MYLLRVGRGGVSFFTMDNNIIMFIIKNNETHGASILLIISSLDSKDSVTVKLANGLHVRNTFLQIWSVKKKKKNTNAQHQFLKLLSRFSHK